MAESGVSWILRLRLRPSEKRLPANEQRLIARQRWAGNLLAFYHTVTVALLGVTVRDWHWWDRLPASFTQVVDAVAERGPWVYLLVIPYGISASVGFYAHSSAVNSSNPDEVHDKRLKGGLSSLGIMATSFFLGIYLWLFVSADIKGIIKGGTLENLLLYIFPVFPLMIGVLAGLSYFVTPWGLIFERATERARRDQENLGYAWAAFSLLHNLPDSYQVWTSAEERAQMGSDIESFRKAPLEHEEQVRLLWQKLKAKLAAVRQQLQVEVDEGAKICKSLEQLVASDSFGAADSAVRHPAHNLDSAVTDTELDIVVIPRLQTRLNIIKADQVGLCRSALVLLREHAEQKIRVLESLNNGNGKLSDVRKELATLTGEFPSPVLLDDVEHRNRAAKDLFEKLLVLLKQEKGQTVNAFRTAINGCRDLAERIRERGSTEGQKAAEEHIRELAEMEEKLEQISAGTELDMVTATRFEDQKKALESLQRDLCMLYLTSVLSTNADMLKSLTGTPADPKKIQHLQQKFDAIRQRTGHAGLTDILKVDEEVREIVQEGEASYVPLLLQNASTVLDSISGLQMVAADLAELAGQVAIDSWSPVISQRLAALNRDVANQKQQLSCEPVASQVLHDAWRQLADADLEIHNLTNRLKEVIAEATEAMKQRFSPYLNIFQKVSEQNRWDSNRQRVLIEYLADKYKGRGPDEIETALLTSVLGDKELVNLLAGGQK